MPLQLRQAKGRPINLTIALDRYPRAPPAALPTLRSSLSRHFQVRLPTLVKPPLADVEVRPAQLAGGRLVRLLLLHRCIERLVGVRGFEPPAPCSQGRCSRQAELHSVIGTGTRYRTDSQGVLSACLWTSQRYRHNWRPVGMPPPSHRVDGATASLDA